MAPSWPHLGLCRGDLLVVLILIVLVPVLLVLLVLLVVLILLVLLVSVLVILLVLVLLVHIQRWLQDRAKTKMARVLFCFKGVKRGWPKLVIAKTAPRQQKKNGESPVPF